VYEHWIHLAQHYGLSTGCCEHGFIKAREFLDQLSNYLLIKKASVPWS